MNESSSKQPPNQTLMELLLSMLLSVYRLSPVWWALQNIRKLDHDGSRMYSQNFTDFVVLLRLGVAVFLVTISVQETWSFWISLILIIELFFAYLAHFFSQKFNSAGPGKVTSIHRSLLIVGINYIVFVLLYSTVYRFLNSGLSKLDGIFFSAITITTLGCDNSIFKSDGIKMVAVTEVLIGVFLITFILGSVLGWGATRGPKSE